MERGIKRKKPSVLVPSSKLTGASCVLVYVWIMSVMSKISKEKTCAPRMVNKRTFLTEASMWRTGLLTKICPRQFYSVELTWECRSTLLNLYWQPNEHQSGTASVLDRELHTSPTSQ